MLEIVHGEKFVHRERIDQEIVPKGKFGQERIIEE